jgi:hypothetical protein
MAALHLFDLSATEPRIDQTPELLLPLAHGAQPPAFAGKVGLADRLQGVRRRGFL